jgi:4-amino-4-deoxy-L-arabinose transferase-like glycosyltransferase
MKSLLPALKSRKRQLVIALVVFLLATMLIVATAHGPGITWDEPIYLSFAANYVSWFEDLSAHSFEKAEILRVWWVGQAHPPFGKLYIAVWFKLFFAALGPMLAARMGAGVLFGLAAALIFLWGRASRGEGAGLCAAAVFVFMPRLFAHGHFANLEMMTLLLWLATTIAFQRGVASRGWSVICGVLFGLTLLTKINGVFLPIFLVPWGLLFHGRKSLRNLLCMGLIGPAMFFIGWPAMWADPVQQITAYLKDKTDRFNIPVLYLGQRYKDNFAPWHYPFVMLMVTTPLPVLIGAVAGAARFARRLRADWRGRSHEALLLWGFLFPVLLLVMPWAPKYDGIRLMLPACPFLALVAAEGGASIWEWMRKKQGGRGLAKSAVIAGATWLLLPIIAFHPFQLCYYNELIGGPWGARKAGFETTYWSDTFEGQALKFLNSHVSPNGSIAFVAMDKYAWMYYRTFGYLRKDIRLGEFADRDWEYLVVVPRQGWFTEKEKAFMKEQDPAWSLGLPPFDAPPICLIYRLPAER